MFTSASLSTARSETSQKTEPGRKTIGAQQKSGAPIRIISPLRRDLFAWQREHCQRPAQRGVGRQTGIATDRAEARGIDGLFLGRQLALIDRAMPGGGVLRLQQTGRKTDARPATDTRQHANILLAAMFIGHHVADDAGRGLELVEFLARL